MFEDTTELGIILLLVGPCQAAIRPEWRKDAKDDDDEEEDNTHVLQE